MHSGLFFSLFPFLLSTVLLILCDFVFEMVVCFFMSPMMFSQPDLLSHSGIFHVSHDATFSQYVVVLSSYSDDDFSKPDLCHSGLSTIYNMCTQKPPQDYSQQLYDRYKESFEEYINAMVLKFYPTDFPLYIICCILTMKTSSSTGFACNKGKT